MNLSKQIEAATLNVTKKWKAEKRKADREDRVSQRRLERMRYYVRRTTIRDAAFSVMEEAYNKASSNGKYYANARQIMYAARPKILEITGKKVLKDVYFTQTLLKDYLEAYRPDWKVVWDARGHFMEPYTGKKIGLGGIDVIDYIEGWHSNINIELPEIDSLIETKGPNNRFKYALFIEKEGFTEILKDAGISERYDMALMSTKGIPVKAACDLIESMVSVGVQVFVLHDFDLEGFKILRTLKEGTRLSHGSDVIDLGLRIGDIKGLVSEPVFYDRRQSNPRGYLIVDCEATEEEADFLVAKSTYSGYAGHRVELNAMTSEQLITWLEKKLKKHGVKKFIPDSQILDAAFRRAAYLQQIEEKIEELEDEEPIESVPNDIQKRVAKELRQDPKMSWDNAVWNIVKDILEEI